MHCAAGSTCYVLQKPFNGTLFDQFHWVKLLFSITMQQISNAVGTQHMQLQ